MYPCIVLMAAMTTFWTIREGADGMSEGSWWMGRIRMGEDDGEESPLPRSKGRPSLFDLAGFLALRGSAALTSVEASILMSTRWRGRPLEKIGVLRAPPPLPRSTSPGGATSTGSCSSCDEAPPGNLPNSGIKHVRMLEVGTGEVRPRDVYPEGSR